MRIATSADLAKLVTKVMAAMDWEKMPVKEEKENPEGSPRPCVDVGGYGLWQDEDGKWVAEVGWSNGGSYYDPPDHDVVELFRGPNLHEAIGAMVKAMAQDRLNSQWETLAWDEAIEAEGPSDTDRGGENHGN